MKTLFKITENRSTYLIKYKCILDTYNQKIKTNEKNNFGGIYTY